MLDSSMKCPQIGVANAKTIPNQMGNAIVLNVALNSKNKNLEPKS